MRREEIHARRRRRRIDRRKNGRRKSERRKNERRKNMKIGENGRKESTTSTTAEGIKMMMTTEGMREAIVNRIAIAFVRRAIVPLIATAIIVTVGLALRARDGLKCHIGKTSIRVSRTNLF